MAVPKRKVSNARRDSRRAHWKLALPGMVKCPNCQEFKLPHRVCGNCGFYKGKEIVKKDAYCYGVCAKCTHTFCVLKRSI